jgi:CelD/BcsL family acetyltransferase involved in cellulose biosynthesis
MLNGSDWQRVEVSLAYRLGEMALFELTLRGMADRSHFSRREPLTEIPRPPAELQTERFVFYPRYPLAFTPRAFAHVGRWIAYTPYTYPNYYVDLKRTGSFDAYLRGFSSKTRSTLQRKVKKFSAASGGEIRFAAYRTAAEMSEFLRQAATLSARTYQERVLGIGLPQDERFRKEALELAGREGARGFLLSLQGKPVAYVFCYCGDRVMTYDYVGYDPDAAPLSPGTVLQYLLLQRLFDEGSVDIFDFTEGEGPQKQLFATDRRDCASTYYLRHSLRHALLLRSHHALNGLGQRAGSLLERLRLKAAVRNLIRRAA